ncbi:hypothetical protein LCGC14_1569010, partial [marine sediment metagenome]
KSKNFNKLQFLNFTMKKRVIFFLILLCSIILVQANPYSFNLYDEVITPFDNNTAFVNSTNRWTTNIGNLDGVNATQHDNVGGLLTIATGWLNDLYCKLTGCVMTGDIDMNENNISRHRWSSKYYQ